MIEQQDYHTPVEDSLQDLCSLSRDLLTREAVTTDTPKSRRSLREWLSEGHLSNVSRQLQLQEEGPEQCTSRGGVVFLQEITGYIQAPPPHYSEPSLPYSASSTFPGGPEETHLFFQMFVENCCGDRQQSKGGSPPN